MPLGPFDYLYPETIRKRRPAPWVPGLGPQDYMGDEAFDPARPPQELAPSPMDVALETDAFDGPPEPKALTVKPPQPQVAGPMDEYQQAKQQRRNILGEVSEMQEPHPSKARVAGGLIASVFLPHSKIGDYALNEPYRRFERQRGRKLEEAGLVKDEGLAAFKEMEEARQQQAAREASESHERAMKFPITESPEKQFEREQQQFDTLLTKRRGLAEQARFQEGSPEYKEFVYGLKRQRPDTSMGNIEWAHAQASAEGYKPGSRDYASRVSQLSKSLQREPGYVTPVQQAQLERWAATQIAKVEKLESTPKATWVQRGITQQMIEAQKQRIQEQYDQQAAILGLPKRELFGQNKPAPVGAGRQLEADPLGLFQE